MIVSIYLWVRCYNQLISVSVWDLYREWILKLIKITNSEPAVTKGHNCWIFMTLQCWCAVVKFKEFTLTFMHITLHYPIHFVSRQVKSPAIESTLPLLMPLSYRKALYCRWAHIFFTNHITWFNRLKILCCLYVYVVFQLFLTF